MSKILFYSSYIWNYLLLKISGASYNEFPQIIGRISIRGRRGQLIFGSGVIINSNKWINPVGLSSGTYFCIHPGATISIGNNVGISNSLVYARHHILIDDDVRIGGGCQLLDNDFHSLDYRIRKTENDQTDVIGKKIHICAGVFIGSNAIILKGVEIGKNSIVGAGSVVTKSIPPFEIWGGNPAKFIRKIIR